ncbi:MAG TPA: hypothetical protein VF432_30480 [Thermoanaerobaculia bacterium]
MMLAALALSATLAANPQVLVQQAAKGDAASIRAVRAMGQPGVDALMKAGAPDHVLDAVCRQRDCRWSGLYWYTDLEEAKRVARRSGKPILSLRLLGNLDEELSCANSRYFRTLLYSNLRIRAFLRANYVLHWKSERPAPRITIDFGDGRKMQRTVTGNSIHYVLDSEGRPLDAIPGLYSAPSFLTLLREGVGLHRAVAVAAKRGQREKALFYYHVNSRVAAERPDKGLSPFARANDYEGTREQRLGVWTAGLLAPTKSGSEAIVIHKVSLDARVLGWRDDILKLIERTVTTASTIDANSRAMIRAKRASAPLSERSFDAMLKRLEQSIAADEKINEQRLRDHLHVWVGDGLDLEALNRKVYDKLFLSPRTDPWMGLVSEETFTGIEGEGLIVSR